MAEFFKVLLMPLLIGLGAWADLQAPAGAHRAARIGVLTLLGFLIVLFLTGLTVRSAAPHRSLAHLFVGVAWVAILFAIGVGVAEAVRSGQWSDALPVAVLVLALGAMVSSASTGFLGRLSDRPADVLRFRLFHQLLAPGALGVFLAGWLRLTGRPRVVVALLLIACGGAMIGCNTAPHDPPGIVDAQLTAFIGKIRAVDNHSHANSTAPGDTDQDALPLEVIFPFEVPVQLRPENPDWLAAYKALYKYPHADTSDAHMNDLRRAMQDVVKEQGERFPAWVLDQVGTEVLLTNRVAMGPGLAPPRFRWVSYVDALMLPLSTKAEAATTPDREKLFPLEDRLLRRYLSDLKIARIPATLDAYLKTVVTPTLEAQKAGGCVAVKFEAAFLRPLDFAQVAPESAGRIYARYAGGGEPSHDDYKTLQDFLFRFIAHEAGRLGMAVHVHSFNGPGNFFESAGADPLLLEPTFNDPTLRRTNFVIVHGGGAYSSHAGSMLWKPNVYLDMSGMTLLYTPARLAEVLREWLTQYPEKVLFGSDAAAFGPDTGWEVTAWIATRNGRAALAQALTTMLRNGEVGRGRAEQIAEMVLRTNAMTLCALESK
jgi:uncharacterized protein